MVSDEDRVFVWGLRHNDGRYEHAEGRSASEAAKSIGWNPRDLKRSMPLKALRTEEERAEIREKLRPLNNKRKAERAQRRTERTSTALQ